MKKVITILILLFCFAAHAQVPKPVSATDIKEIARTSGKKHTLFFTFGIWCSPCRAHLPNAIKLAKEQDLEFYVLLPDAEGSDRVKQAVDYIHKLDPAIKVAVLKTAVYGDKLKKRNKKFVTEITPPGFEDIDDFSKYIIVDNSGKVVMVTNYKDNEKYDWKDDSNMINERILPVLSK